MGFLSRLLLILIGCSLCVIIYIFYENMEPLVSEFCNLFIILQPPLVTKIGIELVVFILTICLLLTIISYFKTCVEHL